MSPLVVIGDTLLDVDLVGQAERLCPDAPVPVVEGVEERMRPGGAGLAALLAARDGAEVVLVTALADDSGGRRLRAMLRAAVRLMPLPMRGATVRKTRIRASGQTLLRLDTGDGRARRAAEEGRALIAETVAEAGAVLVSDYGRGVVEATRELLRDLRTPLVWDPHPKGAVPVPGCALVTPNQSEARLMCGQPYIGPDQAATQLLRGLRAQAVAVTLGERGAALAQEGAAVTRIPAPDCYADRDACGAGDRLAAAAALALCEGKSMEDAVTIGVGEASRFVAAGGASALRVQAVAPVLALRREIS
ncbi:bifunctional heptose 7-phosphate kinase/heptose 1-phosphate adenyltransferase [Thermoactinospora rubra]|uniref:bifunctional heptose 7-phosphate kinase/heptose 1-phosphate adenyltransferase n=1 Tax=Thermoactinospora rubra TaxID=1088767 RepID=UPI000A12207C|nr:PfkB family carbohydrate kinase [Thermoactinospora rubra]